MANLMLGFNEFENDMNALARRINNTDVLHRALEAKCCCCFLLDAF